MYSLVWVLGMEDSVSMEIGTMVNRSDTLRKDM